MIFRAGEIYQVIWKAIIRPPRDSYQTAELGAEIFSYKGQIYKRRDFTLINKRQLHLECSHFEPLDKNKQYTKNPYPCVIYLHGNCSSRLEALNCGCLRALLPLGISVLCFDFSGSGQSEGEYVSLGWYERDDLECVVNHLRTLDRISSIGLWGRSMGAVTACLYVDSDPTIAGVVIDSPFSSLRQLCEELVFDFVGWRVPKFLLSPALSMVKSSVQARAKFDIDAIKPIENCKRSFIPALFIAASNDSFIRPQHCKDMHGVYAGDKNIIIVSGTHNSRRPSFLLDSIAIFFRFALQISANKQPADLWESVALSLAMTERSRRQKILDQTNGKKSSMQDTSQKDDQDSSFSSNDQSDILETPLSETIPTTLEQSRSSSDYQNLTFSDEEEELSLTSAVAQMMIYNSIQTRNCLDSTPELDQKYGFLDSNSTEVSTSEKSHKSNNPIVNMPAAPHRVKESSSPKLIKIQF